MLIPGFQKKIRNFIALIYFAIITGIFTLDPFSFNYKTGSYISDAVALVVEKEDALSQRRRVSNDSEEMNIEKHIFLVLEIPKSRVYVNEKVPFILKLYSDWLDLENINLWKPSAEYLMVENFSDRAVNIITQNRTKYVVLEYKSSFFAATAGQFELAPIQVKFDVARRREGSAGAVDLLNDNVDMYKRFIGVGDSRSLELNTLPRNITVLPLPQKSQPAEFKAAVGNFNFDLKISPAKIKLGEAITLEMTISGDGNYASLNAPLIKRVEGIKVYEPEVARDKDKTIYTQAIRIQSAGVKEVPPVVFAYFNPESEKYISITRGPISIELEGVREEIEKKKPAEQTAEKGVERDIIDLKSFPGRLARHNIHFYKSKIFILLEMFPLIFIFFGIVRYRKRKMLEDDPQYAALLTASRKAKASILKAENVLRMGDEKRFYAAVFYTLQEYLGQRLSIPSGGITGSIVDGLKLLGVAEESLNSIKRLFSECYLAKYTSIKSGEKEMADILGRLKGVIGDLNERKAL